MDSIYGIYKNSLAYYEKWTGIPHPFQKHGLVVVPDFQFGGMEHPGAILFQNSTLFLCIPVYLPNVVLLATTSLSKSLSPKYLRFNL